jgi:hypothetical protein
VLDSAREKSMTITSRSGASQRPRPTRRVGRVNHRPGYGLRERIAETSAVKAYRIYAEYSATLYFPLNRISTRERLVLTPRLLLIEYLVYRVDSITERNRDNDLAVTRTGDYELLHRYKRQFQRVLRALGAWNAVVADLIDDGEAFVWLENALIARETATEADLRRVAELRPTDVRLLHAAAMAMLGRQDDPALRHALWPAEVLADIANDLEHYCKDVHNQTFNIYAAYVDRYQADAQTQLREMITSYERELQARISSLPLAHRRATRDQCRALLRQRLDHIPAPLDRT